MKGMYGFNILLVSRLSFLYIIVRLKVHQEFNRDNENIQLTMTKKFDKYYQFRKDLLEIMSSHLSADTYTFWNLHVAIRDSMGWTDTQ